MRLLLIRHGETVDNVAAVYAGTTDSALTNHGVLQAARLGVHLASTDVKVAYIFSSDLQRAVNTAEAIRTAQAVKPPQTTKLEILREQDFGFYEGKKTFERPRDVAGKSGKEAHAHVHRNDPGFRDVETKDSMRSRMDTFVDAHVVQLIQDVQPEDTVAVVAHGIILNHLWRAILKRFDPKNVTVSPTIQLSDRGLGYLGGWSNTGYLDLEITRKVTPEGDLQLTSQMTTGVLEAIKPPLDLDGPKRVPTTNLYLMSLVVKAVNSLEHLKGLKKTRGGLGSLKHDSSQKTINSFFKKRRTK